MVYHVFNQTRHLKCGDPLWEPLHRAHSTSTESTPQRPLSIQPEYRHTHHTPVDLSHARSRRTIPSTNTDSEDDRGKEMPGIGQIDLQGSTLPLPVTASANTRDIKSEESLVGVSSDLTVLPDASTSNSISSSSRANSNADDLAQPRPTSTLSSTIPAGLRRCAGNRSNAKKCEADGCGAVRRGRTPFCISHGGGRRCQSLGYEDRCILECGGKFARAKILLCYCVRNVMSMNNMYDDRLIEFVHLVLKYRSLRLLGARGLAMASRNMGFHS